MKKSGFSLIELIIVLVVIGLLLGFLFPALNQARDAALQRQCANNLLQIHTALVLYARDHHGQFPSGSWSQIRTELLGGYIHDEEVFKCPANGDWYWFVADPPLGNLTIYDDPAQWLVGCQAGPHAGLENKINIAGQIALREPGQ